MTFNKVRLYKEFRALAPQWLFAVSSIVVLTLATKYDTNVVRQSSYIICSFGMYLVFAYVLPAMSFGSEFDHKTIQSLLSEPVPRSQIWRDKVLVLFMMMFSLTLVYYKSYTFSVTKDAVIDYFGLKDTPLLCWFIFFCAGIGGPFFSLFFKQTHLAIWGSLFAPFILISVWGCLDTNIYWYSDFSLIRDLEPLVGNQMLMIILLAPWYILAYYIARYRFLKLEISGAHSHTVSPNNSTTKTMEIIQSISLPFLKYRWSALIMKELRLQKPVLLLSFITFLCWLFTAGMIIITLDLPEFGKVWRDTMWLLRPVLYFLIPLSIGACAVSGERSTGVMDWQQSLPYSRRCQWAIKVSVCLLLTEIIVWGGGFSLDHYLLIRLRINNGSPVNAWYILGGLGAMAAGLYASTLSRLTIQSFVGGILIPVVSFFVFIMGFDKSIHFTILGFYRTIMTSIVTGIGFYDTILISTLLIALFVYFFGYWNYIRRWDGVVWKLVQGTIWLWGAYTLGLIWSELD